MQLSLRTRLIVLCVCIVVGAMAAVATTNVWVTRSSTLAQTTSQAQQLAQAHAETLGQWITAKQQVVTSLVPHTVADDRVAVLQTAVQAGGFDQAYMGYPDGSYIF
ncbi:MAG: hypothetical protein ACI4QS_09105 [Comamonas sp.]